MDKELVELCKKKQDGTLNIKWETLADEWGYKNSEDLRQKFKAYRKKNGILPSRQEVKSVEDDVLIRIEKVKEELYKERQKLRIEKNEYNGWRREQSTIELFYERIDEASNKLLSKNKREIPKVIEVDKNDAKIVVGFADCHYDSNFEIRGFNDEIINEYNTNIFEQRMWKLRDEIVSFSNIHKVKELHIVDLGDSIEGILHISAIASLKNNIVDSILDYSDFIETWLHGLSHDFFINFYTSEGNHSDLRILTGKKGDFPKENLEKIYSRILKKAFQNNPNVKIHNSLDGLNHFDVNGYKFLTAHGQKEGNLKNSIGDYEDTYKINVNYFMVGHLHCKNEIEISKGKEVIQVRSVMGLNTYAKDIKRTSESGATMFTVHKNYGRKYINELKF